MSHKTRIFFNSEYCYFTYHEGNCANQLYGSNHLTRVAVVLSSADMLLYLGISLILLAIRKQCSEHTVGIVE